MISDKMAKSLNDQLNRELYAAHLYLAMSAYCESEGLSGFASWLKHHSEEEHSHAMKIYGYLTEQDCRVTIQALKEPQNEYKSVLQACEAALEHEKYVTKCINEIVDQAIAEKDHATNAFLQWFVTEQVEEEATVRVLIDKVKMVKESPQGLYIIDREAGSAK